MGVIRCEHSRDGRLMISASVEGVVVLYDVNRMYEVVKTIPVEISGDGVDACFSYDSLLFGVLGTNASTIFIWDCRTLSLKFRINTTGAFVQRIYFAPNN